MQKAEFSETRISLGKGTGYLVKQKAKFSPLSGVCPTGCGNVQITIYGTCPACNAIMIREHTWDSVIRRFETIYQENMLALSRYIPDDYDYHSFKFPIMIGHKFYSVPLRYIQEFESLKQVDQEFKNPTQFFSHITEHCRILKL